MEKLIFRIPSPALIAAGVIAICATPFAWAAPGLQAVYLLPAGFAVWVLRNRTTVDRERIAARGTFRKRVVAWDDVRAIKVVPKGWLSAVLADDELVRLPAVRAGHLSALAAVSGGRVPDPKATTPDPQATAEPDPEATTTPDPATTGPKAAAEPGPKATAEPGPKATATPAPEATAPSVESAE
ncbi:PH domain-containing protein [Saccharothrix obliqua]|uniref:PH domain-containing protein n=1 Tax=Saccharothrix obliqua TaxID=2861747 RepID=UPI001C6074B3|nr:PH domain-containing protein [Saccharothrix obliqua]MBW4716592.1 PH domain-containing protein [Saccharothrix obliqua]